MPSHPLHGGLAAIEGNLRNANRTRRPLDLLDPVEKNFVDKVREHGFFRTEVGVGDEMPGFSYTTGFWISIGQPELIMFSMKGEIAHSVFWELLRDAKEGKPLPTCRRTNQVFGNLDAHAFPIAKRFYAHCLGWSQWFYGRVEYPCLQIVWPDRGGVFPWEAGFDPAFASDQPDLTEKGWQASIRD